ncbi:iron uptake porin [Calothrix sp. NIES-3974]|uniref:iron uptake porin n=1 Tax=Calothrix sp. NIES-3974 TaxID=2005462 RepID=UPI000BBBB2A3|nr:iron uptake porin [Calothrix sp. NIES-3974]
MTKGIRDVLKVSPVILAASFLAGNGAIASEVNQNVTSVASLEQQQNSLGQVTSVSQFSDVQPTDWAFQALQSLVERYGCIAGYPNGTYRGNRALTRYEFAAGLNACLDRVNELIATATADLVSKEDLATLQRLQEEFAAELATLRGRVDTLEARTAELEANQFSTTTKLRGEAIFNVTDTWGNLAAANGVNGENQPDSTSNTTFANRVRLSLESSFTGRDKLQTRLNAGNIVSNAGQTGTGMTRLAFDGGDNNNVELDKLNYSFNLGNAIAVKIDATGAEVYENINNFNPLFSSSATGAISRYGRFSPIYRFSQGGAGVTATFNPKGTISASAAYMARENANPNPGNGVFEGDSAFYGQIDFKPSDRLNVGLTYARSYNGTNLNTLGNPVLSSGLIGATGSRNANAPFGGVPTEANSYGVQAAFGITDKITLAGWYGLTEASSATSNASADINYWAATLGIRDLGSRGSTFGVIFGQPPKVAGASNGGLRDRGGTSYHLETLYRFNVTNNISLTPGLLVIFNPEHNNTNDTVYVGTLRTTFRF